MLRYAIARNRSLRKSTDLKLINRHCLHTTAEGTKVTPQQMVETRQSKLKRPKIPLREAIERLQLAYPKSQINHNQPVSQKHAAVLIPLFESINGDIHVILTQRSPRLNSHAGEVCFPGGKKEPEDVDDVATALREAEEELGIPPTSVSVITTLPPVLSKHYLSVTPVIGVVDASLQFKPNPAEVQHVFTAPLSMFLESGSEYSYRDVSWESFPYRLHYWKYVYTREKEEFSEFLIWGLTAGLLIAVAEKALGRKPDFRVDPPGARPYTALAYENGRLVFRGGGG